MNVCELNFVSVRQILRFLIMPEVLWYSILINKRKISTSELDSENLSIAYTARTHKGKAIRTTYVHNWPRF